MDWKKKLNIISGLWSYRNSMADSSGPIKRKIVSHITSRPPQFAYDAYAWLIDENGTSGARHCIYGDADGTGTSSEPAFATIKAISECIERWAVYKTRDSNRAEQFGFDANYFSDGCAALPGQKIFRTRELALQEAIERWIVPRWWLGEIEFRKLNIPTLSNLGIDSDLSVYSTEITQFNTHVAFAFIFDTSENLYQYFGFAASHNLEEAVSRATIEAIRNQEQILRFLNSKTDKQTLIPYLLNEKRLLYFSTQIERVQILKKIERALKNSSSIKFDRLIIDSRIDGEWDKYATVWRCLFHAENGFYNNTEIDWFMF